MKTRTNSEFADEEIREKDTQLIKQTETLPLLRTKIQSRDRIKLPSSTGFLNRVVPTEPQALHVWGVFSQAQLPFFSLLLS